MSWESTAEYYRLLNRGVAERRGGLHSAPLLVHSVDFAPVAAAQSRDDWTSAASVLSEAARGLERAGAGALILCTNTMHVVADAIQSGVSVPLLHIVDPTGQALLHAGVQRAALLGTRFTMERPFWRARLEEQFGVMLEVPARTARAEVHRIIYEELCLGVVRPASRTLLERTMSDLADEGAQAIILGCTELTLLVGTANVPLPIFDTTTLHAAAGVAWLLNDESPCE